MRQLGEDTAVVSNNCTALFPRFLPFQERLSCWDFVLFVDWLVPTVLLKLSSGLAQRYWNCGPSGWLGIGWESAASFHVA